MCQKELKMTVGMFVLKFLAIFLNGVTVGGSIAELLLSSHPDRKSDWDLRSLSSEIFYGVNLACLIISLVSFAGGCCVDMRGSAHRCLKYTDGGYHVAASLVVIISSVLMIIFCDGKPVKFFLGVGGVIDGILYLMIAGTIFVSEQISSTRITCSCSSPTMTTTIAKTTTANTQDSVELQKVLNLR